MDKLTPTYQATIHAASSLHNTCTSRFKLPQAVLRCVLTVAAYFQVGVSIEPLAEVSARESSRVGDRLGYAKRVGMDLYHFLASFATQTSGDTIVIPTKALDRCEWKRLCYNAERCCVVHAAVTAEGGGGCWPMCAA
jgi:hypothetical protein